MAKSVRAKGAPLASEAEWKAFLESEERSTCAAYKAKARLLERDRKAEKSIQRDYVDRELLELVQNAADAATEVGGGGRVKIIVSSRGLLVANTGEAFRDTGIEALLTAHLSDKPNRRQPLIGAKGLGFRSILNWSLEPMVFSGTLRLAFCQARATERVAQLAGENEEVRDLVGDRPQDFAPVLPFPIVGAEVDRWLDPNSSSLIETAERLRVEGYDTVVVAPFHNEQSYCEAIRQASEFRPHFLLFVPALTRIEIELEGEPPRIWVKQPCGDNMDLEISEGGFASAERWHCRFASGEAPAPAADGPGRYEVAVAVRMDQANAVGRLHSFFPTNVILPLTALFHGTFELQSNRKLLLEKSDVNASVQDRLAELYAQTLADLLKSGFIPSAIPFLLKDRPFPSELAVFEKRLLGELRTLPVVPTLGGPNVTPEKCVLGPALALDFLPHRLFPQLARCRSGQERELLQNIGVVSQEIDEALARIVSTDLTLDERAALIVGMASHLPEKQHRRNLLIDEGGQTMGATSSCFPPASGLDFPSMPGWANRRFINAQLWDRLTKAFPLTRRQIIQKLTGFGVQEYDLSGLVRALLKRADAIVARSAAREAEIRSEVLGILQKLHARETSPPRWLGPKVKVLTQTGEWRFSEEVHLSQSYGREGRITQALFRGLGRSLLDSADRQGVEAGEAEAAAFFLWIGVHAYPRTVSVVSPSAHHDAVLDALPETFPVTDGSVTQLIARSDVQWGENARFEAQFPEGLSEILATAPSEAILAWLARDPRLDVAANAFDLILKARKNAAYLRPYEGDLPDLVRLEIGQAPWLACADGTRRPPAEVLRDQARLDGLFARPARLDAELAHEFGLDRPLIMKAFTNAGVRSGVDELPERAIYDILLKLPERDLPPEVVKRFYLQILEREEFEVSAGGAAARRFLQGGKVQCRQGGAYIWVPVAEAYYADRDGSSAIAREQLALIDLPTRRSAVNVNARFGVSALSRSRLEIGVTEAVPASASTASIIQHRFESALPFIRAFRSLVAPDGPSLKKLDTLRLHVCARIQARIIVQGNAHEVELPAWTHLLHAGGLYVTVDEFVPVQHTALLAMEALTDGLSDVFEVQSSAELAKLLGCEDRLMRRLLLHRMLPNFQPEEIDALVVQYPVEANDTISFDPNLLIVEPSGRGFIEAGLSEDAAAPVGANDSGAEGISDKPSPAVATESQPPCGDAAPPVSSATHGASDPGAVIVTPVDTPATAQGTGPLGLRIHFGFGSGGGGGGGGSSRDPYSPLTAEIWAGRFEEQQGRFPLSVAHLQGKDALGCDLVSFTTEEDKAAFVADGALSRVARFIEVKSGAVHLGENQTAAAKKHKQRFYIYRIAFDDSAHTAATLTLINDPLSYAAALARELRLDLDDVSDRATFRVHTPMQDDLNSALVKTG